jgi:hypothetical protein
MLSDVIVGLDRDYRVLAEESRGVESGSGEKAWNIERRNIWGRIQGRTPSNIESGNGKIQALFLKPKDLGANKEESW